MKELFSFLYEFIPKLIFLCMLINIIKYNNFQFCKLLTVGKIEIFGRRSNFLVFPLFYKLKIYKVINIMNFLKGANLKILLYSKLIYRHNRNCSTAMPSAHSVLCSNYFKSNVTYLGIESSM